jgi:hypothetical protein
MRGRKLTALAMGLSAATLLLGAGAASASTTASDSSDPCVASGAVCIDITGAGLYVQSATVTNVDEPIGYGWIENEGDGVKHRSPHRLPPGGGSASSWTYNFNRDVKNDDEICAWIGSVPSVKACAQIHA